MWIYKDDILALVLECEKLGCVFAPQYSNEQVLCELLVLCGYLETYQKVRFWLSPKGWYYMDLGVY